VIRVANRVLSSWASDDNRRVTIGPAACGRSGGAKLVFGIGRRWLNLLKLRNLCLLAGAVALVYIAATIVSYARVLGEDVPATGDGLISGDYAAFYAAGRLVLQGQTRQLYDASAIRALQRAATNERVPDFYVAYRNPPFFAPIFAPFARLDLIPSFTAWSVLSLGLLITAISLALWTTPRLRPYWKRVALVAAGFCPIYSGLVDGQNATLSLLLYVLVYRALRGGQDGRAGVWAALGLFKPQLFFVLPLVFAAGRRWRALAAYAGTAAILALVSLAIVGIDGALAWARIIVEFEPGNAAKLAGRMYSLKALFDVLLPGQSNGALILSAIGSLGLLGLLVRVWRVRDALSRDLSVRCAFTFIVALLVDPHLLDYDLTVLVLPSLLMVGVVSDAPWWIAGLFIVTMIDLPLSLGILNLQIGVLLLVALAIRLWWRLESNRGLRLLTTPASEVIESPQQGVAYA
jgi:alpha-1,2-mannosyltransferase